MDIHPTPFPAKSHRSIVKPAAAKEVEPKASRRPPWQNPIYGQSRTKRTFGTIRNTNSIIEKPAPTKPLNKATKVSKPLKPTAAAVVTKVVAADTECIAKKGQHVTFQEFEVKPKIAEKVEDEKEEAVFTPMASKKDVELLTPFFTAENCSKCRLDKLESTAYWLDQIKVAESVGKHFVSANFFRLALECHAQPLHRLRGELRYYMARHKVNSDEPIWVEVLRAYGMLKQKTEDVSDINFNSVDVSLGGNDNSILELDGDLCSTEQTGSFLVGLDDSEHQSHDKLLNDACENDCPKHANVGSLPISKPDEDNKKLIENSAGADNIGDEKLEDNDSNAYLLTSKVEVNDNSNTPSTLKPLDNSTGKSRSLDDGSNRSSATSKGISNDSSTPTSGASSGKSKSYDEGSNGNSATSKGVSKELKTPRSGASSGKKQENVSGKKVSSGTLAKSTTRINRGGILKGQDLKDGSSVNKKLNDKMPRSPHIGKQDQL